MGDKPKSAKLASDTESGASADEEVLCGLYGLKISSLQCFANVQSFTFFYGLAGLMTQTLTFYVNSQVPNMEKQFGLSSAESGLLMSFNDIGFLLCSLFISSLARFVHIPRFLFYCTLLYGFSGIICSIPHYITPNIEDLYVTSGKTPDLALPNNITETESSIMPLCVPELQLENRNFTTCEDDNRKKIFKMVSPEFKALAIGIIAIGMMVQGIGKAPRAPFVTVYIDDNVEKRKTGFYIGIMSAAATMGPALAFGLGGYLSKIYVTLEDVPITPKDPRFIGAWWLGFLVFGLGSLLVAIPIILFPNRIKWNQKKVEEYRKDMPKEKPLLTTRAKVKDRVSSYWRIMKNPIYISILVTNCAMVCGQAGYISFLAKYIQTQFGTPLWQSNLILAVTKLVGLAIGAFVGGFLTRKIPMIPRNTFGLLLILFVVQNGTFIFGFFLGCDQPRVVGPERKLCRVVDFHQPNPQFAKQFVVRSMYSSETRRTFLHQLLDDIPEDNIRPWGSQEDDAAISSISEFEHVSPEIPSVTAMCATGNVIRTHAPETSATAAVSSGPRFATVNEDSLAALEMSKHEGSTIKQTRGVKLIKG